MTQRTDTSRKTAAALLALALMGPGCTKDPILEPIIIEKKDVPFDLADKNPSIFRTTDSKPTLPPPPFSREEAEGIFKTLCRGGKPRKKVETKVVWVIPHVPAGMALDKALEYTKRHHLLMTQYIANFYELLMFNYHADRLAGRATASTNSKEPPRGKPFLIVGAEGDDPMPFIEILKAGSVDPGSSQGLDPQYYSASYAPVLLRFPGSKKPQYAMSIVDPHTFFQTTQLPGSNQKLELLPRGLKERVPLELFAIGEAYTLAVSKGERDAWHEVAQARNKGQIEVSLGKDSVSGGKVMPRSELLSLRKEIWRDYLVSNTSIKESTTDDGQVFAYTLRLTLEPMCRLGRLTTTLTSQ